jgi:RimJ/RimL family protein N-acetyltransferase
MRSKPVGFIEGWYVDEDIRNNGAGKYLVDIAQKWAVEIKRINACIYTDNHRSISLAQKLGFNFYGKIKNGLFRGNEYTHKIFVLDCPGM